VPVLRPRVWIPLVFALALAARAVAMWHTPDYVPHHDDYAYLAHALALVKTHAYPAYQVHGELVPTAYRAPGFPVAMAAGHRLLGGYMHLAPRHRVLGAGIDELRALQVVIGAAVPVLVGVVARQVWGPRTALVAAVFAAVSPVLVLFNASLISEPLFTALLLGALACALHAKGRTGWAVAAGVLAAAATLTRAEGLVLILTAALCAGGRRAFVVTVVAAVVCVAPWTIRNAVVMHSFVPVSTETGNTLAGTYNTASLPDARWRDPRLTHLYPEVRRAHRNDEAALDHAYTRAVLRWLLDHPLYPLKVVGENALRMSGVAPTWFSRLSLDTVSLPTGTAPLLRISLLITTLLAIAGALTAAARRASKGWWATAGVIVAVGLLVNAEQRFALPLQPFFLMLAALPFTRGT
jgi:4-amino-4-deoxy-L-arabinose transferase-like glycosyltransferase